MNDFFINEIVSLKKDLQTSFNCEFDEFNLKSSEIKLIHILSKSKGESQAELAKKLDCDKSHIHRIVIKLLMKKVICISKEKQAQSRKIQILLTSFGKEIAEKINKKLKEWKSKLIEGISIKDIDTIKNVFHQISENLKKEKNNA